MNNLPNSIRRDGLFPPIDEGSAAWRTAVAVAHIADEKLADRLASDVLWYHADYVAPAWAGACLVRLRLGRSLLSSRLNRVRRHAVIGRRRQPPSPAPVAGLTLKSADLAVVNDLTNRARFARQVQLQSSRSLI